MDTTSLHLTSILQLLPQFILSFCIIIGFLITWKMIRIMVTKIFKKGAIKIKNHIMLFIIRSIGTILFIIALIILLGIWGIDVSSIIAGLGLTGFALGFALKDVLASSIAGFLLLFHQPFKIKSRIAVLGVEGIVVDIDMRYTTIEDSTGKHLIPNSKILSEKVTLLKDD
jgi:small conductance mechanosensitive channel